MAAVFLAGVGYTMTRTENVATGVRTTYLQPLQQIAAAPPATPLLVTIGDSFTDPGGYGEGGWAALLAADLGVELINPARAGAGYVRVSMGTTFPLQALEVPDQADVVVIFGGYNDAAFGYSAADTGAGARAAFATVRRQAPDAALLVIGPQWPDAFPSPAVLAAREAVQQEAHLAGAVFVDPIADQWLAAHPEVIGPDGLHPNLDPGQQYLAGRIGPYVAAALAR